MNIIVIIIYYSYLPAEYQQKVEQLNCVYLYKLHQTLFIRMILTLVVLYWTFVQHGSLLTISGRHRTTLLFSDIIWYLWVLDLLCTLTCCPNSALICSAHIALLFYCYTVIPKLSFITVTRHSTLAQRTLCLYEQADYC